MSSDASRAVPGATQMTYPETTLKEGIYIIGNRSTRMHLDLTFGSAAEGAPVRAWFYVGSQGFAQSWLITPEENGSFVIRNIGTGKVLDFEGSGEVGRQLLCTSRVEGEGKQEWRLELAEEDFYSIRNTRSSENVLEVHPWGEVPKKALDVLSGKHIEGAYDQQWKIERRSLTVSEVRDLVIACPILQKKPVAWPSADIRGIFMIKGPWRIHLINESGILWQSSRPGVFDHTAFAMKLKETIQSNWAKAMKIDGYAILFGVVGGSSNVGSKAYNWYLTDDLCEIVFLDPLDGRELTAKGLQKKGFQAEWAIF